MLLVMYYQLIDCIILKQTCVSEGIQQGRRGSAIGVKPRLTSLVGHAEVGARSMDTRNVLPDFSKRESKYYVH